MLRNIYVNNAKVGTIMITYGICVLILQTFLSDMPALIAALLPIIVLLYLEKTGKFIFFQGLTASVLVMLVLVVLVFAIANSFLHVGRYGEYAAAGALALSFVNILGRVILTGPPVPRSGR